MNNTSASTQFFDRVRQSILLVLIACVVGVLCYYLWIGETRVFSYAAGALSLVVLGFGVWKLRRR